MTEFKVGDRVTRDRYEGGTIVAIEPRYFGDRANIHIRWDVESSSVDDTNDEQYLQLLTEGGAPVARRTFKLIKETPGISKGAIMQEDCEDGTQPYTLITREHIKGTDKSGNFRFPDRSLIENQPSFFVEVFAVEPQYMTREELDQWEAFKAAKPAKAKKTADYRTILLSREPSATWSEERRKAHSARMSAYWAAKKAA